MENTYTEEQFNEIFSHEIKNMIVRLLRIYTELSLAQLSEIMSMNKTTIQYHLMHLREKGIIYVSRESQEDSRGSIPTKYYQLKLGIKHYRANFDEIRKIKNLEERLLAYGTYMQNLLAGLKDIKNQLSYAESALEKSLNLIDKASKKQLSDDILNKLDEEINGLRSGISSFSTTKENYFKIVKKVPAFYESFEINDQTLDDPEGYEIITLSIPLVDLIKSKLENKKKK